jgi:hypothetical protein
MTDWQPPARGALDDTDWPQTLVAKAVWPESTDDRLHGYAILGDVSRHYRHSDLMYLAITGELPDDRQSKLFHVAVCSYSALAVDQAPTHVGVLSRICGGNLASALGAGLVVLADKARFELVAHAPLLGWLANAGNEVPPAFRDNGDDHAWVAVLRETLAHLQLDASLVRAEMTRNSARIALLFESGLRTSEQMEAAIVSAGCTGVVAEALCASPRDLGSYPVKLPPFHYIEGGA